MQGRGRSDDKETYILETFTPSTEGKITKPLRRRQRRNFVDPAVERVEDAQGRLYRLFTELSLNCDNEFNMSLLESCGD